jgi:hypothetical protein
VNAVFSGWSVRLAAVLVAIAVEGVFVVCMGLVTAACWIGVLGVGLGGSPDVLRSDGFKLLASCLVLAWVAGSIACPVLAAASARRAAPHAQRVHVRSLSVGALVAAGFWVLVIPVFAELGALEWYVFVPLALSCALVALGHLLPQGA